MVLVLVKTEEDDLSEKHFKEFTSEQVIYNQIFKYIGL